MRTYLKKNAIRKTFGMKRLIEWYALVNLAEDIKLKSFIPIEHTSYNEYVRGYKRNHQIAKMRFLL